MTDEELPLLLTDDEVLALAASRGDSSALPLWTIDLSDETATGEALSRGLRALYVRGFGATPDEVSTSPGLENARRLLSADRITVVAAIPRDGETADAVPIMVFGESGTQSAIATLDPMGVFSFTNTPSDRARELLNAMCAERFNAPEPDDGSQRLPALVFSAAYAEPQRSVRVDSGSVSTSVSVAGTITSTEVSRPPADILQELHS